MAQPRVILGDGSEMNPPAEWPLVVRMMIFDHAGDQEPEHTHRDGHWTVLHIGRFLIYVDGMARQKEAPDMVWIAAMAKHQITALTDGAQASCLHDKRAFA